MRRIIPNGTEIFFAKLAGWMVVLFIGSLAIAGTVAIWRYILG